MWPGFVRVEHVSPVSTMRLLVLMQSAYRINNLQAGLVWQFGCFSRSREGKTRKVTVYALFAGVTEET